MYHPVGGGWVFDRSPGSWGGGPGFGADEPAAASVSSGSTSTTWITGGLIVLLAIGALAIEKKGPAPLRRASS